MSWSTTPPDAPGLYWVVFKDEPGFVLPAHFAPSTDGWDWTILGSDEWFHTSRFSHFQPLPRPALPPT